MRVFNIHEAKTQLSRLVEQAARGEPFVIARAGKPLVKVIALDAPEARQRKRRGFLAGQIVVPDDFDRMGSTEIDRLF
jgi:prevent-host-death family protein